MLCRVIQPLFVHRIIEWWVRGWASCHHYSQYLRRWTRAWNVQDQPYNLLNVWFRYWKPSSRTLSPCKMSLPLACVVVVPLWPLTAAPWRSSNQNYCLRTLNFKGDYSNKYLLFSTSVGKNNSSQHDFNIDCYLLNALTEALLGCPGLVRERDGQRPTANCGCLVMWIGRRINE